MRADRLLSILLHLQTHGRTTAGELARRLEVSERTIHRDMEALGAAGVPVLAERGSGGGWSLLDEYRTDLTGLNAAEVQALFLARPAQLLSDLGLAHAADAALVKLLAALPSMQRPGAEYVRQRIHIDPTGWNRPDEAVPRLPALQEAIWRERRLQLTYRRGDGDTVERLVDPLGLVAKGSVWYLVAAVDGEPRTYRASRILAATTADERCERPASFDLAAYWEQSAREFKAGLPRYHATLRAAPEILPRLRFAGRFAHVEHAGEPDADGWVELAMRFQFEWEACEYALSFGARMEVLAPPSLREQVIRAAKEVVAFYSAVQND